MKKHLFLFSIIFFLFSCKTEEQPNESEIKPVAVEDLYQTLKINDLNLTIDYPKNWSQIQVDSKILFSAAENDTNPANIYRENMVLNRIYNEMVIDSLLPIAESSVKIQYPEATNITTNKGINSNGMEYGLLSLSMERNNVMLTSETYYFIDSNHYYILNLGYDQKDVIIHRQICDHIFNSLKF